MSPSDGSWSVIVHGGARTIAPEDRQHFSNGCLQAVKLAADVLSLGGSALDAAEKAVRFLEDSPLFNAGHGSVANAAGEIEMDAAIMDGETLKVGGIGAIRNVRHPIQVARALMSETPILLVGAGACAFARTIDAEPALRHARDPKTQAETGCDTVGCVARDVRGHLVAAGSTGGLEGKMVGRVGDTPLPGCGLYADDARGAVACSGDGENIARVMLAAQALGSVLTDSPRMAAQAAVDRMRRVGGEAGVILIDPSGRMGAAHNSEQFSLGIAASWLDSPKAATDAADLKEWLT